MNNYGEMDAFSSKLWYNPNRVKKNGDASLYLQVVINRKHKEFPLKLRWLAAAVDLDRGVLLPRSKGDQEVNDYNLLVETERAAHTEIFRTYRLRKEPLDIEKFARELITMDTKNSLINFMRTEIERRFKRKEIERKTRQNALATLKLIEKFDREALFCNINKKWMKSFQTFMLNSKYKPSTVWARIASTKTYLQLASLETMLHVDQEAIHFKNPQPTYVTTYCNRQEVRQLLTVYNKVELTNTERQVLKAFMFTIFTSLRISDVYRVNSSWQITEDILQFVPKKNAKRQKVITIPIMPGAKKFISKIDPQYFNLPTEQEYNRTLKTLAKKAGINKRLTSHTGRHTFGYLLMTNIGNQKLLQEILGHSKSETTDRYSHLDEDYKIRSMRSIQDDFDDLL